MFKPISVSLSPNILRRDVYRALRLLLSPSHWIEGGQIVSLEKDFERLFPKFEGISFSSGRAGLLAILRGLGIGQGDEVLVQSFSCVVVANGVIKAGARPIFVDIEKDSFNMDPVDLVKKITSRTKAVVVQHTFGFPAKIKEIVAIGESKKIKIIEDCAHGIDILYGEDKIGSFGSAAFFSFGRDKVISSTFGGMVIAQGKLAEKIRSDRDSLPWPSRGWTAQQLLHPVIFAILLPVYNFFSLGKVILVASQVFRLLSKAAVEKKEKAGRFPGKLLVRLPNSLASLAWFQLKRLGEFNANRQKIVDFYASRFKDWPLSLPLFKVDGQTIPLLRFTIRIENPQALYLFAKKRGIILNNWYYPALSPEGVDYRAVGYDPQSCPTAERESERVVNLPTHPNISLKKAERVVKIIEEYLNQDFNCKNCERWGKND